LAGFLATFDDPAMEKRFRAETRLALMPYVRLFGFVSVIVVLGYTALNALAFKDADRLQALILCGVWLLLTSAYVGSTFWRGYVRHAAIDFAFLLAIAMVLVKVNMVIFQTLDEMSDDLFADGDINRMIISVFAAIALAGRAPLFIGWILLHAGFFMVTVPLAHPGNLVNPYEILSYATAALVAIFINWLLGKSQRNAFALRLAIDHERARNEELLYKVLPSAAALKLKAGEIVADSFSDATVIFIDVVGFSVLAKRISPGHLIELLNGFFGLADRAAAATGVEKVKTIGDAYLAISGGNIASANSADTAIAFGRAVIAGLPDLHRETGIEIKVRIGIHSGPVVGGVIGATRMAYDYWGETMNIASRIEGVADHNGIAVSEATYLRARDRSSLVAGTTLLLKGVGDTMIYRYQPQDGSPTG
jgi:class 3 adenylate cyclase